MTLKVLDLFSGIGGFSYAAERLVGGFKTTQFVEIDPYCQSVLRKNFNAPIHDDIKTFKATKGQFDIITAGFPCQDLSLAGRMEGLEGERSGLFFEVLRLARQIQPKFILFENVRNLLSHKEGETYQQILQEIAKAGFDAEWSIVSAKDVGACHKRERIWIIAYPSSVLESGTESTVQAGREAATSSTATNTDCNGSSTSKRLRVDGQTDTSTQERENEVSQSKGSSKSRGSEIIQRFTEYKWEPQESRLNPYWKGYISQPTLRRGDDGLSNRVLRLKSLGNSIVPACAAVPLQRIKRLSQIVGEGTMGRTYIK